MKEKKQKLYMAPVVKTVEFYVEGGFAGTTKSINQPSEDENDGMFEKMDYQTDDPNDGGWDWTMR